MTVTADRPTRPLSRRARAAADDARRARENAIRWADLDDAGELAAEAARLEEQARRLADAKDLDGRETDR